MPYLECLERRQLNAWNFFENELVEKGLENRSLGKLRLHWQDTDNIEMLNKLQSLILRGVPSALRPQVWAKLIPFMAEPPKAQAEDGSVSKDRNRSSDVLKLDAERRKSRRAAGDAFCEVKAVCTSTPKRTDVFFR